jgi:ankyrin repeat protein
MTPNEQDHLDLRLIQAANDGRTREVRKLLSAGADVHAMDDRALGWAIFEGHVETVKVLLAHGADARARSDDPLEFAVAYGHTEIIKILAKHIFAPDLWRGKSQAEIEQEATALYDQIKINDDIEPEPLRQAGMILADYALRCWEQIRPAPPKLTISPLPAKPRPA